MIEPNNPKFVMLVTSTSPEATTTTSTSPEVTSTPPPTTISPAECLALNNLLLYLKEVNGNGGQTNNTGVMPFLNTIYTSVNNARDTASKIGQTKKDGSKKFPNETKQKRNDFIDKAIPKIDSALPVIDSASTEFTAFAETFCDTSPQPGSCSFVLTTITQLNDVKNNLNSVKNSLLNLKTVGPGKIDDQLKYPLWGSGPLKNQTAIINNQRENTKTNWQNIQQFMKDNGCKVNK